MRRSETWSPPYLLVFKLVAEHLLFIVNRPRQTGNKIFDKVHRMLLQDPLDIRVPQPSLLVLYTRNRAYSAANHTVCKCCTAHDETVTPKK
jgi:hypothetical protein